MTIILSLTASIAALAIAWFVYRTSSGALSKRDAASVFVVIPIAFAALAVWKANPWLAGVSLMTVAVGWIYILRSGREQHRASPQSNESSPGSPAKRHRVTSRTV